MAKKLTIDLLPMVLGFGSLVWFSFEVGWKAGLALFIILVANGLETAGKKTYG